VPGSVLGMVPALTKMTWPRVRDHLAIGASTGYMSGHRGDWDTLARTAADESLSAVEFSALSEPELPGLVDWLEAAPSLPFRWIAAHAPAKARAMPEADLVARLARLAEHVEAVVVHPDTMDERPLYRLLGAKLALENMDTRKPVGQRVDQLERIFDELPEARLCFDVAHAGAVDPSMAEGERILEQLGARLSHVHVSSLDANCHHVSLTEDDEGRFGSLLDRCRDVPWILEAPLRR
jgi:sugar phosphate isomerase/epimerase